jgi:hypothetical protein
LPGYGEAVEGAGVGWRTQVTGTPADKVLTLILHYTVYAYDKLIKIALNYKFCTYFFICLINKKYFNGKKSFDVKEVILK